MSLFRVALKPCLSLAVLLVGLIASGCQVKPLYSQDSHVAASLASIEFADAGDRVELEVRNNLIFFASGGQGEASIPAYRLDYDVKSRVIGVLLEMSSDTARAGRVEVSVDYTLKRANNGEVLKAGHRSAVALIDFPGQEFAHIRAIRDAENRAARELAELIRADLAAALGR